MHCRSLEHRYLEKSGSIPFQRKLVVFVLACAILALNSCKRDSESHPQSAAHPTQKVVAEKHNPPMLPPCPDAHFTMLKAKDPTTRHHKVFLTWNASTSANESDPNALGYCLYRTQTPGKAKDCPKKFPKCEQVNVVPVSGTRCVDELVRDNSTYYYVAVAITSTATSTTSEEAIVEVPPAGKQNPPPPDVNSYPACRTTATSNQPPGR
jgi:hypothetical protein